MKRRLYALCDELRERFAGETFRAFVDTAPVMEREHAVRAGLGWFGKHTLLIHPRRGSYLLLGGIVTTLGLDSPRSQRVEADHCGTCTRCIEACPTDAITPYSVDASRCISELTIERRGMIPGEFHEAIGEWLFGCDICQEVCPHNSAPGGGAGRVPVGRAHAAYGPKRDSFDLLEVLGWTEADRRAAFAGSALKRAKLGMIRRNALIVAGNVLREGDVPALRARIEEIARDEGEEGLVRETARAVAGLKP
jgi:epoxyqueuosine reductase